MLADNFIVFEGIDKAGKSTQIELLKSSPFAEKFFFTSEPTSFPTGKFLRSMLKGDFAVDARTSAFLFAADRSEHVWGSEENSIHSQLKQGKVVISDRYFFSSLAYQSVDCSEKLPRALNSFFPLPVLLFFFAIEPEIALSRIGNRQTTEIYEKLDFLGETETQYEKIINEYESPEKNEGMKIVRLDASKPKEQVHQIILSEIKKLPIFEK